MSAPPAPVSDALILLRKGERVLPTAGTLSAEDLPAGGDTLIRVEYSSLNYKDALAVSDRGRVIRADFPFVPGIESAGGVIEASSDQLRSGAAAVRARAERGGTR